MTDPTQRRPEESVREAAIRVAIDAVYEARDSGGTMHTAGELAAERVLAIVNAERTAA
jgi:hypothetical protein